MDHFGPALAQADEVVLTDIYAAGEDPDSRRDRRGAGRGHRARSSRAACTCARTLDEVVGAVLALARPGDAVITLGAGSIGTVGPPGARGPGAGEQRGDTDMSVTVPADRRFRRSQIPRRAAPAPARAPRWWRVAAGRRALAGLLAGAAWWAAAAAVDLPWLRVQHILVEGNQRLHAGEVTALLDGLTGESLLAVDLERWRARLFASSWVADATLRRRLPGTIVVELREREPIGIARAGTDLFLVDAAGTVIDEFGPRYADCDLPIIDGLLVTPVTAPPRVDRARGQLVVAADVRAPRAARRWRRRVSQIDATNAHDVHVILDGDPAVVRLGDTQFVERLESYVRLPGGAAGAGAGHRLRGPALRRTGVRRRRAGGGRSRRRRTGAPCSRARNARRRR